MSEHNIVIREQENIIASETATLQEKNEARRIIYAKQLLLAKRELIRVIVELEKAEHSERSLAGQLKNAHTVTNKGKILKMQARLNRNVIRLKNQFQHLKDQVYRLDQLSVPKTPW